ncbi:MAG: chemotaxis protein CheA, partial [Acidobacteria bacterium]
ALEPSGIRLLLAPAIAGLIVAALVVRFFLRVRGSGVNQTKAAVYVFEGYVPFRTVWGKFLTCALAIGSGHSLGPEDPSLQMGAGIASALGRWFRLSRDKIRLIAPVGAAAGLAAAFNAPISAVIFVIEEVIGNWTAGALGAIVLAAVSSVAVVRVFLGPEPMFHVPVQQSVHPSELLGYAFLGVIGGVASLVFIKLIAFLRPLLKALGRTSQYFQPAAAGLLIGWIGLSFPQVMGAGYEYIDQALHSRYEWRLLALLAALKILTTTLSFASGTPGGMFAPTLFVGAMLGGAVGALEHNFVPWLPGSVGPYALVGMGVLFAGFLRVPFTSIFMVLEVSGNYSLILPVMISNTIAYLISRQYQSASLFDLLTRQDGIELPSMEEQREEAGLRIEDAMRPAPAVVLDAQDSLDAARRKAEEDSSDFFLVRGAEGSWSGIGKTALEASSQEGDGQRPLSSLNSLVPLPAVHPDHSLDAGLRRMGDSPFLPVIHRADLRRLEGVISLDDILRAYRDLPERR